MDTEHDRPDPRLAGLIDGLIDREPERDLWPNVSARLTPRHRGRLVMRWPTALAAGLALIAGSAALTILLQGRTLRVTPVQDSAGAAGTAAVILPAGFAQATGTLQQAIDELEQTLAATTESLDPTTRDRVREAIVTLDAAIADARQRALGAPTDLGAARYLTRAMQRKLDVLQSVATLTHRS